MLQSDYPGYIHIQMAGTPELRVEALTAGDISYTPKVPAEEIVTRHGRYIEMLDRLRDPDRFREVTSQESAMSVLFVGDRNVGTTMKGRMSEAIQMTTAASTAGQMAAAKKHDAVLVQLGAKEDAKERFTFLQVLLKDPDHPKLALLFLKQAPDQIRAFCEKSGVAIIESTSSDVVEEALQSL